METDRIDIDVSIRRNGHTAVIIIAFHMFKN